MLNKLLRKLYRTKLHLIKGYRSNFYHSNPWSPHYDKTMQRALDISLITVYFLALVAFAIVLGSIAPQVHAKTFYVTNTTDAQYGYCSSPCTLRDAVDVANNTPGPDTIIITAGTYVMSKALTERDEENELIEEDNNVNGDLDITFDVVIEGEFGGSVIIDGNDNDRLFEIISGNVVMRNLTFTGGRTPDQGGAIENKANLTLWYSKFQNNRSVTAWRQGRGGAIANYGELNVYQTTFLQNSSSAGESYLGGGGAIYNEGQLRVRESSFEDNFASGEDDWGSGGAIYNVGSADIRRSTFIKHESEVMGTGAAILNAFGGQLKLVSSTVSDNTGGEQWGAAVSNGWSYYFEPGEIEISHSTIVNNYWNGLFSNGPTYIKNSIIAGNTRPYNYASQNCRIVLTLDQIRDPSYYKVEGLVLGEGENRSCHSDLEIPNKDTFITLLKPLAYNGGPTLSHALREGSVAVDAGGFDCPGWDQRAQMAPRDGDGDSVVQCDIGAFELQP